MGKSIVSRGKTVKEAVSIALDLLGVDKNEVDIEILENETRGLLGIGSKPAQVRVAVKDKTTQDSDTMPNPGLSYDKLVEAVDELKVEELPSPSPPERKTIRPSKEETGGKVWVTDGHIFCKDAPDEYPLLSPGKVAQLYNNDELVNDTIVIRESDILRVELQDEVREASWELYLSPDKMEVVLKVVPGTRIIKRLVDMPPSDYIELDIVEKRLPFLIDTGPILQKLNELGVVQGIDYIEIARACSSEEAGAFVIARGSPPLPGKHGFFNPMMEVSVKKGLKERSDGKVDYREVQEFPSVDRGQVIGVVHPPMPGVPGQSVTNEPVFPPDVSPLTVVAGKGTVFIEEGSKVIATDAGHPEIKLKGQRAHISVIPKLLIGKDVDFQSGNIRYIGDVEISGSVQDGMTVEAQGNLLVHHNVHMAKISAGQSIIVRKNIITSEIVAGRSSLLKAELSRSLVLLIEQMKQMVVAVNQLSSVSAFKVSSFTRTGLGPLIKILCDGKFKTFPPLTSSFIQKTKAGAEALEDEWTQFGERLRTGFLTVHSSNLRSVEDIGNIIRTAEQLLALAMDTGQDDSCFIKADFVHNSRLYSSGDIVISGQGIYNSTLHAEGFAFVEGFVRGGEIYAAKGAEIGEAGTKGGIATKIVVPRTESIKIKTALEDTWIQIGSKQHQFKKQTSRVWARVNEDGELIIT